MTVTVENKVNGVLIAIPARPPNQLTINRMDKQFTRIEASVKDYGWVINTIASKTINGPPEMRIPSDEFVLL
jgi:hypothetical protein